jgi:hypothetical protein
LDPTPDRPQRSLAPPSSRLTLAVDVYVAHLANPLTAISRMLASEAGAFTFVRGDESHLEVSVALPDDSPETRACAEAWMRWVIHNAGVRGHISRVDADDFES